MEYIIVILLTAVILAQIGLFTLFILEKRRNDRRQKAMLDYIENAVSAETEALGKDFDTRLRDLGIHTEEMLKRQDASFELMKSTLLQEVQMSLSGQEQRFSAQLKELMLDYSQAREAAGRINDFGASLAAIFDYDPVKALQKIRKKEVS